MQSGPRHGVEDRGQNRAVAATRLPEKRRAEGRERDGRTAYANADELIHELRQVEPGVGGAVEPASEEELAGVVKLSAEHDVPFMMLGRGSNLLVRDGGIRGIVICLAHPFFSRIEVHGSLLECGAGARMRNVSFEAKRHSLTGLEFLEGIPGSIGGGLRMNAGAYGMAMASEYNLRPRPAEVICAADGTFRLVRRRLSAHELVERLLHETEGPVHPGG